MPLPLVAPQRPSDTEASAGDKGQTEAQQAKHAGMGGGRVPKGPPQQSRCKWQLKPSAQVIISLHLGGICGRFGFEGAVLPDAKAQLPTWSRRAARIPACSWAILQLCPVLQLYSFIGDPNLLCLSQLTSSAIVLYQMCLGFWLPYTSAHSSTLLVRSVLLSSDEHLCRC